MGRFFTTGTYYVAPRALAQFVADDPWTGARDVDWVLVLYLMEEAITGIEGAQANARRLHRPDLPGPGAREFSLGEVVAIERRSEARPIFLPHALSLTWRGGGCPPEAIPRVLHDLEPRLVWSDYLFLDMLVRNGRFLRGIAALAVLAAIPLIVHWTHVAPPDIDAILVWLALIPIAAAFALIVVRHLLHRRLNILMGVVRARLAA